MDEVLKNPYYLEVLLCVISGKNYASVIARSLEKTQPTVTEQLKELERVNLIKPLKRGKAQRYRVNWDLLLDIFYSLIEEVLEYRKGYLDIDDVKLIDQNDLRKIIPQSLIMAFLEDYMPTLQDLGGKRKGFDEIIFSFFCAINKLDDDEWNKLCKYFKLDKNKLSTIAIYMEFEIYGLEQVILQTLEFTH